MSNETNADENRRPASADVPRRTLVKGAAWSIPVMAVAVGAPMAAASGCREPVEFIAPGPGNPTLPAGETTTFPVPAGVTSISYVVIGGSGGGRTAALTGGAGSRVSGTMTVTPGQNLYLTVGQGGLGGGTNSATGFPGGQGYGNGGASGATPAGQLNVFNGASGGGGSAIRAGATLATSQPVVVAGGGAGGGSGVATPGISVQYAPPGAGATGGASAADAAFDWAAQGRRIVSHGGSAASGASAGAGGIASTDADVTPTPVDRQTNPGSAGTAHVQATGGDGGSGGASWANTGPGTNEGGATGGGGGGGYAGGGGGGSYTARYEGTVANGGGLFGVASGGGGGSSYVAAGPVAGVTPVPGATIGAGTGTNPTPNQRVSGSIVLTYVICP